ncbi:glycosyltransferase family 2 protein [Ophiostoma piceae UAMH 11346]|uniref:chitin synthase n=1 Tax=Ophiostoma piceae (strain UAMH 11346) TaxID=1262450 RepID=S3BPM5_OPHP1|nr:glycosyltransferase family 2 protein [Ophiostoma piceae UAMH 11346]
MAPDLESPWPVHDIVYTSIVGLLMIAACLEWFLWIAAFLYCLCKVFRKAEHWTVNVLAILVGVAFTLLRLIFLPIMIVTLPLPGAVVRMWPADMVAVLQWFAFWSFAGLLTVPWLFCVYQIVTHQLGRTKRIKQVLDEVSAPKVVIVMPCYREEPAILITAINSVVDCDYPPSCIHVFLSFDGDQEDELYLNTIEKLGVPLTLESYPKSIDVTYRAARVTVSRFPHGGKRHCQKSTFQLIDRVYQQYLRRNDNLFILFIDSDCLLDRVCLQNFVYDMELSPGNRRDMLAMTGVITSTTKRHSLITLLQDMEYVHGQLFERTVESGCGAVTCLPGALTMLRFSAFRRMAKYYFADKAEQCEDLFDFAKCHLGEDRWLTHLFMIGAKKRYQIQMCTSAFCKTEAVQTVRSLIKQRRRWFLGFLTNEVCMLTDWRLWKRYPILILVRFMQNTIRTTGLLFFILVLALLTTSKRVSDLPVGFIAVSLGLNWVMMIYFGFKLRRFKIMLYPLMFVLSPFFNWYYMVYGIFTAGQRTWGGPRADAAAADGDKTTVQDAIEQAEKTGDDLNIVPESFMPAAEVQRQKSGNAGHSVLPTAMALSLVEEPTELAADNESPSRLSNPIPYTDNPAHERGCDSWQPGFSLGRSKSGRTMLQPPDKIDGMFSAPQRTDAGWYHYPDDSMASLHLAGGPSQQHNARPKQQQQPHQSFAGRHPRHSSESSLSSRTNAGGREGGPSNAGGHSSVYMPRRVESLMSDEDRRKYEMAQASQLSFNHGGVLSGLAGPSRLSGPSVSPGRVYEYQSEAEMHQAGFFANEPSPNLPQSPKAPEQ